MSSATLSEKRARAERDRRAMLPMLRAVAALVLLSLTLVTGARIAGLEPAATPDDGVAVAQERMIRITGALDGSAQVADEEGRVFLALGPMEGGFISGVHRALERTRKLNGVDGNPPVRLVRFADGRLGVRDPTTGWRAELIGFGETNRAAFEALLAAPSNSPGNGEG